VAVGAGSSTVVTCSTVVVSKTVVAPICRSVIAAEGAVSVVTGVVSAGAVDVTARKAANIAAAISLSVTQEP
jgi:hypothetical protein